MLSCEITDDPILHGLLEIVLSRWWGEGGYNSNSIYVIQREFGTVTNNCKAIELVHFNCHITS